MRYTETTNRSSIALLNTYPRFLDGFCRQQGKLLVARVAERPLNTSRYMNDRTLERNGRSREQRNRTQMSVKETGPGQGNAWADGFLWE